MKKSIPLSIILTSLLAGCSNTQSENSDTKSSEVPYQNATNEIYLNCLYAITEHQLRYPIANVHYRVMNDNSGRFGYFDSASNSYVDGLFHRLAIGSMMYSGDSIESGGTSYLDENFITFQNKYYTLKINRNSGTMVNFRKGVSTYTGQCYPSTNQISDRSF